jgi:hypothetical protein
MHSNPKLQAKINEEEQYRLFNNTINSLDEKNQMFKNYVIKKCEQDMADEKKHL